MTDTNTTVCVSNRFWSVLLLLIGGAFLRPAAAASTNFIVTTTADAGAGSLREAISNANSNTGVDLITFSIPGSGPFTIQPATPLPVITDPLVIDATTQTGYSPSNAVIHLDGTSLLGSLAYALHLSAGNSTIRGLSIGHFDNGILIDVVGTNLLEANFIGTTANGAGAQGCTWRGVVLDGVFNNTLTSNVIANNGFDGLTITNGGGNLIVGNFIGIDVTGQSGLGNGGSGITVANSVGNIIGNTNSGFGNIIAFNVGTGVATLSGTNNAILGNSIYSNQFLGIDLGGDDVTLNDSLDADTGANNLQNFPILTSATASSSNTVVQGTLSSKASTTYRLEFFINGDCDPTGYGQGESLVGATNVITRATGGTNFTFTTIPLVLTGQYITATATDPFNNTSEFSPCVLVTGSGALTADLTLSQTATPNPVAAGANVTFAFTIHNNGPTNATAVTLTDVLPAGATYFSATASQGSCTNLAGTITCNLGTLNNGGNATVNIVATAGPQGVITNVGTVATAAVDPVFANNTAYAITAISPRTDLRVSQTVAPNPVLATQTSTFTIIVTNAGPSTSTAATLTDTLPAGLVLISATSNRGGYSTTGNQFTGYFGTLLAGDTATVNLTVRTTTDGNVNNTASVSGPETDPVSNNNSATTGLTVNPMADLSVAVADAPDPTFVSGTLTATVTVVNNGPSTATGTVVTNTLPAGVIFRSATPSVGTATPSGGLVVWNIGNMNSGTTETLTVVVTPNAVGTATDTATVGSSVPDLIPGNNTASASSTVDPGADLALTVTDAPDPVVRTDTITYSITVTNRSGADAPSVVVSNTLPHGVTLNSAVPSYTLAGNVVIFDFGTVAANSSAAGTIIATVNTDGTLTNTAVVSSAVPDGTLTNNTATTLTTVSPMADLGVTLTGPAGPLVLGSQITLNMVVTNPGPSAATSVTLTNQLPSGLIYVSATNSQGTVSQSSGVVRFNLGTLAAGGSATAGILVNCVGPGNNTSVATVTSPILDRQSANNSASYSITLYFQSGNWMTSGSFIGDGSTNRTVTGLGFTPDVVIIKANNNQPAIIRTSTMALNQSKLLDSSGNAQANAILAFTSSGFVVGANSSVNASGTAIYWVAFRQAASQLRIGTFTGDGTVNRNITGVGFQPDYVLVLNGTGQTAVHRFPGLVGDASSSIQSGTLHPNYIQAMLADGFQVGSANNVNQSGADMHYVAFHIAAGQVAGNNYVGNGSATNYITGVGFQPGYVLIQSMLGGNGVVHRSASVPGSESQFFLGTADTTTGILQLQPGGFQVGSDQSVNASGATNYFMAFRDAPTFNAPVINVPGPQTINANVPLVFSTANGNAISITDTNAGVNPIEVTLTGTNGTVTLNGTAGLTLTAGDGTADATMTFRGTVANINTALNGLTFTPTLNYSGSTTLTISSVDDTLVSLNIDVALKGRYTFDNPGVLGQDSSPAGTNTGTVTGATAAVDATRGKVLRLDAAGGADFVQVTGHFGNPTNVTLAAWVNLTAAPVNGAEVISLGDSAALRLDDNGNLKGYFYDGSTWRIVIYATTLAGQGWHHVAYTFDTAANQQTLYLDGVAVASAATTGFISYTLGASSFIGTHANGSTLHDFTGLIDDARVYARALGAAEIAILASDLSRIATTSVPITVNPVADLALTQTVSTNTVYLGANVTYTFVVANSGPGTATAVVLPDTFPANLSYVSSTVSQGSRSRSGNLVTANFGAIGAGSNATLTVVMTAVSVGTVTNSATVTSSTADPNAVNNSASAVVTLNPAADVQLTVSAGAHSVYAGDTISFAIKVANSGPSPASAVSVTNPLPAGFNFVSATADQGTFTNIGNIVTFNIDTLASGQKVNLTVVATPTQTGFFTNTASVVAAEFDPVPANNTAGDTINVNAQIDLQLSVVDSPNPVPLGALFTITYTITNASPFTATGVLFKDEPTHAGTIISFSSSQGTIAQAGNWVNAALGSILPGGVATITIVVRTDTIGAITHAQAEVDGNEFDPNTSNNKVTANTTVTPSTDLAVSQTTLLIASNATYRLTLTVTNLGPSAATSVVLTDALPAELTFVSASVSQGTWTQALGTVTANLGALNAGRAATVTIVASPNTAGLIVNTATVTATEADPQSANNTATATFTGSSADMAVTVISSPDAPVAGQPFKYLVTVINDGPLLATGVVLTNTLPAGVTLVTNSLSQGTLTQTGNVLTWALGNLNAGASATLAITLTTLIPGSYTNAATVGATQPDTATLNNSAFAVAEVAPAADIAVSLTRATATVYAGSNVTYLVTVTNNGPAPATDVKVTGQPSADAAIVSAATATGTAVAGGGLVLWNIGNLPTTGSATLTLVVTAPAGGNLTNVITGTAVEADLVTTNNTATNIAVVNPSADLSVDMTASPDPVVAGTPVTFTMIVSNAGPAAAIGATLSDPIPTNVTFVSATSSTGTRTLTGGILTASLGTLNAGAKATVTLTVIPHAVGALTNTTLAGSSTVDVFPANNGTRATTLVIPDTQPPTITAPPAVTVNTAAGHNYATGVALGTPLTADNVAVASVTNDAPSQIPFGTNTVTWTVTDTAGNTASAEQTVIVRDAEAPTIALVAVTVSTDPGQCFATGVALGSPITVDNVGVASVSNNAPATFPKGTTFVTWTVTDTSGNTGTATQNVTVSDTEPPTITAPAAVTVSADSKKSFATGVALGSPTTADNCGVASVDNNAPTRLPVGTNTVTWTVTDTSGNTATATQTVTVSGPVADLTGSWVATKYGCFTQGSYAGRCYILGYLEVDNIGTVRSEPCTVSVYRSQVPAFDASAVLISSRKINRLLPGRHMRWLFGVHTVVGDIPTGEYLVAVIDSGNQVVEITKTNNIIVDAPLQ